MDEAKVLVTQDGLGRIAIVRRSDGHFCLYQHWLWSVEGQARWNVSPVQEQRWDDASVDPAALYDEYTQPLAGLFDTIERAETEARSLSGFADAAEYLS